MSRTSNTHSNTHSDANFSAILPAPFGALGVRLSGDTLLELVFLPASAHSTRGTSTAPLTQLANALNAYYANPKHRFNLSDLPPGTPFRQRVWQALLEIPAGQTATYGEVARRIGSAPRAVGQALGDNPWPILIPCHRVVAANSSLGGFNHSNTGYTQDIKRWLLRHEGVL